MPTGKKCPGCGEVNHIDSDMCACGVSLYGATEVDYDEKIKLKAKSSAKQHGSKVEDAAVLRFFGMVSIIAGIIGGIAIIALYSKMTIIDPQYSNITVTKDVNNPAAYFWAFGVFISGLVWGLIMTTLANTFKNVAEIKQLLQEKKKEE